MNELQQSNGVRTFWKVIYYLGFIITIPSILVLISIIKKESSPNYYGTDQGDAIFFILSILLLFISLSLIIISKIFSVPGQNETPESFKAKLMTNNLIAAVILGVILLYSIIEYHNNFLVYNNVLLLDIVFVIFGVLIAKIIYIFKSNFHIAAIINKIMFWAMILGFIMFIASKLISSTPIFANAATTSTPTTSSTTLATTNACAPSVVKPEKQETRLGTIATNPDILQVGGLITSTVTINGGISDVTISTPAEMEVYDYSPKTLPDEGASAKAGNWKPAAGKTLPDGVYSVTYTAKKWTNYAWQKIYYTITNNQGTGNGNDNFYVYYNTVPIQLSLGIENQAPQSTKQVVRKVDIVALPGVKVNLTVNKGGLGKDISSSAGTTLQVKADSLGKASAYLFANEGDTVKFTANSPDSCLSSEITQSFTIPRSDIARTYVDKSWQLWLGIGLGIIIIILVIYWLMKRRKDQSQQLPPSMPVSQPNPDQNNIDSNQSNQQNL